MLKRVFFIGGALFALWLGGVAWISLDRLWQSGEGRLSTQVLQEFYVNATRKLTHPLSPEEAQTIVLSLSQWDYHRPDVQDILAAAVLAERYRISFWDALIVHSAEVLGASLL